MATLMKADGGARFPLAARGLIGRSSVCTLRLTDTQASGEHARISFAQGSWSVRDLGSRNGTWVNGERLPSGSERRLAEGDRIAFGDAASVWTLVDASPPAAMARRLATGAMIAAEHGMLSLPSEEAPLACVVEGKGGGFLLELGADTRPALDGETIEVGGEAFLLHLPHGLAATAERADAQPRVEEIAIQLRVSRDEERVEVTVKGPGSARILPARAHHYTLLTVARARLRDQEARGLVEAQRGWVSVDELCRSLAMEETRLNVEIHRIRQDFAGLGLPDAASVIERRRGTRQLRLGTARVVVEGME